VTGLRCARCGAPVGAGALFCMKCGADVSGPHTNVTTRTTAPVSSPGVTRPQISQTDLLARLREATLGDYEILAELGRGGMATVYLAHDLQLDRKVAIKVLNPGATGAEGLIERFRLEARTAAKLSHPNIIPIHAVRETENLVYFVMKFVVGRALDSIIRERSPLPIPMVRTILTKVAEALGYAHRHGVVHRDIKPANIMIDAEGMPVVTDFGIAKVVDRDRLTMTGTAIGTPTYMSPEQCNAGTITGASDQYSLGVVAYEMLTGQPLYASESVVTVMFKHCHEPPPTAESFGTRVPADLAQTVIRMLQKSPADRWSAMEDALPGLRGADTTQEDGIRTQMIAFAQGGTHAALLQRLSTPRSPIPVVARIPVGVAAQAAGSGGTRLLRRRLAMSGAVVVLVGVAAGLAIMWPWSRGTDAEPISREVAPEAAGTAPASAPSTPDSATAMRPAAAEPVPERVPGAVEAPPAPVVGDVRILDAPSALPEGQTAPLGVRVYDQQGRTLARQARWSSSDPAVAVVEAGGLLRALAAGSVTITATVDGRTARVAVQVTPVVAEVVVTPATGEMRPGDALVLSASAQGRDGRALADRPISWRSSDEGVAVVSSVGRVTAVGLGSVVITATSDARAGTARITVSAPVVAPAPAEPPPPAAATPPAQELISRVVDAYARALEAKDLGRVKALHPGISAALERRTREALEAMEDLRVRLVPSDITVNGSRARARVTGQWVYRGGQLDVSNVYGFERRGDDWVIVSID
jgi:Protein kinase domain/Bacterial Ig-like domain (group 2)